MGSNRRHPHSAGELAQQRALRDARARGPLHSLSAEQLVLTSRAVTVVPDQVRLWGLAWLRFGDVDVQAVVRVRRWTDDALGVEVDIGGELLRCWVGQGACRRLEDRRAAW